MRNNALSVANYFLELAKEEGLQFTQLGLMKRVYIAHGFSLAIHDVSLLDPRFDKVEAWRYGPVIPSVYHSFKQYKASPITEKTFVMEWDAVAQEPTFHTPELHDDNAKEIVKMVLKRYKGMNDSEMVSLTHHAGSPWAVCYIAGRNKEIPDEVTKLYYSKIVERVNARKQDATA